MAVFPPAGAKYRQVMGWERPVTITALAEEIDVLRTGAGLADWTSSSRWRLNGAGAERAVSRAFGGLS